MKRITIIIISLVLSTALLANSDLLEKLITVHFNNTTLKEALVELEKISGIAFAYNNELEVLKTKVTGSFENRSIKKILDEILKDTGLSYKMIGNNITIFQSPKEGETNQSKQGSIEGKVIAKKDDEPLPYVSIILEGTNIGGVTDLKGNFRIGNLEAGTYDILVSFIGYEKYRIENVELKDGELVNLGNIQIKEGAVSLNDITVTPGSFSVMGSIPLSKQTLSEKDIKNMSFAEDITRAVARLPGVSSNDFSSKFTVRGGEADEVLINLDGMELYEPFHQRDFAGGLFSIVDIEAVQGVDLLTGGFGSEYGNRQSGVFNMTTKQPRNDERNSSIGISIMNARVYTDGTFMNNKGSYLITARRGMLDQTFKLIGEDENMPTFYDMLAKVSYKLNNQHTLSMYFLHAGDKTAVRDVSEEAFDIHDTQYTNTYSWLTLKSTFTPKLSSRSIIYTGLVNHSRNGNTDKWEPSDKLTFQLQDQRDYDFFGIKQDWNYQASDCFFVKSGFEVKSLNADYKYNYDLFDVRTNALGTVGDYYSSIDIEKKVIGMQGGAYLSGRIMVLPRLFLEPGIRYDYTSYSDDKLLSPRLSVAYAFSNNTILRGAWGYYYQSQFINNLDVNHNSNEFNPAELSKHYILGFEHLFEQGLSLRLEAYYKDISNISTNYQNLRDPWEVFPESRNDVVRLDIDKAMSRGIELFLKYDTGKKISWWLSYSLAGAEENILAMEFDGVVGEQTGWQPRINNQLHTVYCDVNYKMNQKWHFNLSWQYYLGWPLTLYDYNFTYLENGDLHFYPEHLSFREDQYPAYHRMDVRINRHFDLKYGKLSAHVHVINMYNRENLRKFDLDVRNDAEQLMPDGNGGFNYLRDDKNWFGLIPVIGVSWEF
jgi:hypothetical protein